MKPEWIPIDGKHKLPRMNRWVLVTREGVVDVARRDDDGWTCVGYPIAWAELPEPYRKPK